MICDNCGAIIDKGEEYCPNCGMELIKFPVEKKKSKNFESSNQDKYVSKKRSKSLKKPIKDRYIEYSDSENPDYSYYGQDYENEYGNNNNFKEETAKVQYKKSSGTGLINIFLFLFIALLLGLIVGLLIFGSQSAQILGYKI
jgi:uncharacterized Zn finger protein (UPF0148 family)